MCRDMNNYHISVIYAVNLATYHEITQNYELTHVDFSTEDENCITAFRQNALK